jgi:hypothetical protein
MEMLMNLQYYLLSIRPVSTKWSLMCKVYKIKFYAKGGKLEEWDEPAVWWCEDVQRFASRDFLSGGQQASRSHARHIRICGDGKRSDYSRCRRASDRTTD